MFLVRADRALSELDQGQHELRDAAGLAQGTVAVAAETLRTLSGLVAGFLAGHPDAVIVCEGDEPYAIRGLISAGVGIGLMPAMARRLAPDPPVVWLHLDVPCRRTLSLVWRADAYQPATARAVTEFAAGYFRTWRGDA
jgi:DNA-binding transcriptional LysR family regulator